MSKPDNPQINYCKAYLLSQLADYPGWPDDAPDQTGPAGVVFVHSDYQVRTGPEPDDPVIFAALSADWKTFCRDQLLFDQARAEVLAEQPGN